jgi:hypothetical protein
MSATWRFLASPAFRDEANRARKTPLRFFTVRGFVLGGFTSELALIRQMVAGGACFKLERSEFEHGWAADKSGLYSIAAIGPGRTQRAGSWRMFTRDRGATL